jgi:hypothetical protein
VLGIVSLIPSHVLGGALDHTGFVPFIGLAIWILVVGVLLAARGAETSTEPAPRMRHRS